MEIKINRPSNERKGDGIFTSEDEELDDSLASWKMQEKLLPVLSIIARRLHCVSATSAPSERFFSVAGLTISKIRAAVQPQHASDLIFLHDSWRLAEECEQEFEKKIEIILNL